MDKIFTKITIFQDLCAITSNDKTDKQLYKIVYLVFDCTRAFVDTLKNWNVKSAIEKTVAGFKNNMREEHHVLKQVGALSIQESRFYHAYMIQQALIQ